MTRHDAKPMEDFGIWACIQRPSEVDTDDFRELVRQLVKMATQKTAGQRKNKGNDISWDNLERVKMAIICEAVCLVQSGQLDRLEGKHDQRGME